jgi:hypothetical protein
MKKTVPLDDSFIPGLSSIVYRLSPAAFCLLTLGRLR